MQTSNLPAIYSSLSNRVVLVTVPLGLSFDLSHEHTYTFGGHDYPLGEKFLVAVPSNLLNAVTFPDFSALKSLVA